MNKLFMNKHPNIKFQTQFIRQKKTYSPRVIVHLQANITTPCLQILILSLQKNVFLN